LCFKRVYWLVASFSEVEWKVGNVQVLLLLELVFESREEFWVHFESELLKILNNDLKVLLFLVACPLFQIPIPGIDLLNTLGTKDQSCCSKL